MGKKIWGRTVLAILIVAIVLSPVAVGIPLVSDSDENLTLFSGGKGEIYLYSTDSEVIYARVMGVGNSEFEVTLDGVTETCGALWCDFDIPGDGSIHKVSIRGRDTVGMRTSSGSPFLLLRRGSHDVISYLIVLFLLSANFMIIAMVIVFRKK